MNLDNAINNALKQIKHFPQYRMGMISFNDWLNSNYKMKVELIYLGNGDEDCRPEDRKWKVIALDDEGLATMFKLKYA
tara:strand:- start:196 stop:429 length:234 start_codon:yes stop_codon:yes gene_type:complete